MSRLSGLLHRVPNAVIDASAVAVAALDVVIANVEGSDAGWGLVGIGLSTLACVSLVLRRRFPLVVFLLTLPACFAQDILVAPIIALFTLSRISRRRWLLVVCAALFAIASVLPSTFDATSRSDQFGIAVYFIYQLATAAAPVFLGQLVQARRDLAARIVEVEAAKEHEQVLYAQAVLARERARLAREMHDVVSHQVSLIAVQSAALQMTAPTPAVRETAVTIRGLSVTTLDELRTMVGVLRAAGSDGPGLSPQPTMADLRELLSASGLAIEVRGEVPTDAPAPMQRALYRTVQEALTNVRKHAPGADVVIEFCGGNDVVTVSIGNVRPSEEPLGLPGSGVGLLGLRERTELLGGTFTAGPAPDGGFLLTASFPIPS